MGSFVNSGIVYVYFFSSLQFICSKFHSLALFSMIDAFVKSRICLLISRSLAFRYFRRVAASKTTVDSYDCKARLQMH